MCREEKNENEQIKNNIDKIRKENIDKIGKNNADEIGKENIDEIGKENIDEIGKENIYKIRKDNIDNVEKNNELKMEQNLDGVEYKGKLKVEDNKEVIGKKEKVEIKEELRRKEKMKELDRKVKAKIDQEEAQNALHEKMKNKLENIPRYTYRVTKIFSKKEELQGAIDDFNNNGIYNLNSKQLTDNYVEEVSSTCIIFKREVKSILKAAVCGGIIGALIGLFHGNSVIPMPILNPISSGGSLVSTILTSAVFSIVAAISTAIIMLFKPIEEVNKGYYMLTIYADREDKQTIDAILGRYITFDI
ncbi:hypothetical protein [Haloimpatiens massiliensis]|uniref:hypothetical protein n=1 Tax=Haloimpatiens massiliensis TaxID=1658110 RepID=UPI000C83AD4A|nr:hypothetical protein [Haloimpatiens massiliensis]